MNKRVQLMIAMALAVFSSSALAIPLATVIGADNLVSVSNQANSGNGTENQIFADYLGVDVSTIITTQITISEGNYWQEVTGEATSPDGNVLQDLWAFDYLGLEPALFLVKTGGKIGLAGDGSTDVFDNFLYENVSSPGYGVIDLLSFEKMVGNSTLIDIFAVSHVTIMNTSTVPEPGMVALLAIGLVGMVVVRRRMKVLD